MTQQKFMFDCIDEVCRKMGERHFTAEDIYDHCLHRFRDKYPKNKNPKAAILRYTQEARDAGMIEFLGGGVYKRR